VERSSGRPFLTRVPSRVSARLAATRDATRDNAGVKSQNGANARASSEEDLVGDLGKKFDAKVDELIYQE